MRALDSRLSAVDRRLMRVGLPLLVGNAVLFAMPVLARIYLGPVDYASWALLMTVVVAGALFDLGGTAYLQSAGYGVWVGRRLYAQAVGLAVLGVVVVTSLALVATPLLGAGVSALTSSDDFLVLLVATGVGAAVRSVWGVMQTRLQVSNQFTLRTRLSVAQAVTQVAIFWVLLAAGMGLWALPASLILSVLPFLAIAHGPLAGRRGSLPDARPPAPLASFATLRTLSAVLATISSQADRWVLASFAPAAFITNYDLAVRTAALPLSIAMTLFGGVIAEAAAVTGTAARRRLVRSTTRTVVIVVGTLSVIGFLIVVVAAALGMPILNWELVLILAMALIWVGTNAATAPTTMTFIGVGKPQHEFRYTIPTVLCSAAGWGLAVALGDPWLVPVANLVAVTTWSLWFVNYGIRHARY